MARLEASLDRIALARITRAKLERSGCGCMSSDCSTVFLLCLCRCCVLLCGRAVVLLLCCVWSCVVLCWWCFRSGLVCVEWSAIRLPTNFPPTTAPKQQKPLQGKAKQSKAKQSTATARVLCSSTTDGSPSDNASPPYARAQMRRSPPLSTPGRAGVASAAGADGAHERTEERREWAWARRTLRLRLRLCVCGCLLACSSQCWCRQLAAPTRTWSRLAPALPTSRNESTASL
jgi:hypothetical protein